MTYSKNSEKILIGKHMTFQYVTNDVIYATTDHIVFMSRDKGKSWKKVCQLFPASSSWLGLLKDKLLRSKFVRRIRKNTGIFNLVVLNSGTIIIQYDKIYRYDGNGKYALPVFDFEMDGIRSPLENGFVYDSIGECIYFGEYKIERPASIKIIKGENDGRDWSVCYKFPVGRVRHVHGIVPDKYRKIMWICTGDNNEESGLFYTDDQFETLHLFKGGEQTWRMVSLIPTKDAIIWGTDAGGDADKNDINYIYSWNFKKNEAERLACIDNPAYYSLHFSGGKMAIGTTYEPHIKRDTEKEAAIWTSIDGLNWKKEISFPYRPLKRKAGTKYGLIRFPLHDGSIDQLMFSAVNVSDQKLKPIEKVRMITI